MEVATSTQYNNNKKNTCITPHSAMRTLYTATRYEAERVFLNKLIGQRKPKISLRFCPLHTKHKQIQYIRCGSVEHHGVFRKVH